MAAGPAGLSGAHARKRAELASSTADAPVTIPSQNMEGRNASEKA